jgi:hypothetical protein
MSEIIRRLKAAGGKQQPPVTPFIDGQDPFSPFVRGGSYLNDLQDGMYRPREEPAAFDLLPPAGKEEPPPPDDPYYELYMRPRII